MSPHLTARWRRLVIWLVALQAVACRSLGTFESEESLSDGERRAHPRPRLLRSEDDALSGRRRQTTPTTTGDPGTGRRRGTGSPTTTNDPGTGRRRGTGTPSGGRRRLTTATTTEDPASGRRRGTGSPTTNDPGSGRRRGTGTHSGGSWRLTPPPTGDPTGDLYGGRLTAQASPAPSSAPENALSRADAEEMKAEADEIESPSEVEATEIQEREKVSAEADSASASDLAFLVTTSSPPVIPLSIPRAGTEMKAVADAMEPSSEAEAAEIREREKVSAEAPTNFKKETREPPTAPRHLGNNYFECARFGETCTCQDGIVFYGARDNWVSLRVDGSRVCDASVIPRAAATEEEDRSASAPSEESVEEMQAPDPTEAVCRCVDMSWCRAHQSDGSFQALGLPPGTQVDPASRRRTATGVRGTGLHQRRRFCGWGPRDCVWEEWSEFSSCPKPCGGVKKRTRTQLHAAVNGGLCDGEPEHQENCPPCDRFSESLEEQPSPRTHFAETPWLREGGAACASSAEESR